MSTATVWNRESTNYNQNEFVRKHGTSSFEVESQSEARLLIAEAINNPEIDRLDLELKAGKMSWVRKHPDRMCQCDGCGKMCDDCYDQFEQFKQDTEDDDFDLNDPRR